MKSICTYICLIATVAVLFLPIAAMAKTIDRTYWDKAVEIAEKNLCQVPSLVTSTERVFDNDGNQEEDNLTRFKITRNDKGSLEAVLDLRTENGENRTKAYEKESEEIKKTIVADIRKDYIFIKASQPVVRLADLEIKDHIAVYTFTVTADNLEFKGSARIDTKTGCPLSSSLFRKEIKEKDALIKNFKETTIYKTDGTRWFIAQKTQTMGIEFSQFFFTFKGTSEETTLFSDHFCHKDQ